jgi:hypothetical protein
MLPEKGRAEKGTEKGRAACSVGGGGGADSFTNQRKAFKYVIASYRYTLHLVFKIGHGKFAKIYLFKQIFRKVCKKLDFSPK